MRGMRILALTGLCLAPSGAGAATLADANGNVLVNTGSGYRAVPISSTLPPGTVVMVRNAGEARIAYSPLCVVVVKDGQVYTVKNNPPCEGAVLPQPAASGGVIGPALVAGGVAAGAGVLIWQATKKSAASP